MLCIVKCTGIQYKLEWCQRARAALWLSKNGCNGNCAPFGVCLVWRGEEVRIVIEGCFDGAGLHIAELPRHGVRKRAGA